MNYTIDRFKITDWTDLSRVATFEILKYGTLMCGRGRSPQRKKLGVSAGTKPIFGGHTMIILHYYYKESYHIILLRSSIAPILLFS